MSEQEDLERLCRDRPLRTREVFRPNAYYGHSLILKTYAGFSLKRPIYGVVVHGVVTDAGYVWANEVAFDVPGVFSYPPYRDETYRKATDKVVVPSAAPYVYLLKIVQHQELPDRRGTIFFPSHSTHHRTTDTKGDRAADALSALDPEFHPITVCVYWKDFLMGHHRPFADRGFDVVSAGHMYDDHFLFRLHHLCSSHRYASGEQVGSHMFNSVASGCHYFCVPGLSVPRPGINMDPHGIRVSRSDRNSEAPSIETMFLEGPSASPAAQRKAAAYYLGADRAVSPAELSEQLMELERLDRSFVVDLGAGRRLRRIPPRWKRRYRRLLHVLPVWRSLPRLIRRITSHSSS